LDIYIVQERQHCLDNEINSTQDFDESSVVGCVQEKCGEEKKKFENLMQTITVKKNTLHYH
jgi:hypothetical protein